jgi:hypothetical protein
MGMKVVTLLSHCELKKWCVEMVHDGINWELMVLMVELNAVVLRNKMVAHWMEDID